MPYGDMQVRKLVVGNLISMSFNLKIFSEFFVTLYVRSVILGQAFECMASSSKEGRKCDEKQSR